MSFILLTTLTLSHIPEEKMTDATSLSKAASEPEGSVGIALARPCSRAGHSFIRFRLAEHHSPFGPGNPISHDRIGSFLGQQGFFPALPTT